MNELLPTERPRERCLQNGPSTLSLRECIAVILGSGPPGVGALGLASVILGRPSPTLTETEAEQAFFTALEVSAHAHLSGVNGLGEAYRARIMASFELGRRYSLFRDQHRRPRRFTPAQLAEQPLPARALSRVSLEWRSEPREWLGFVPLLRNGDLGSLGVTELGTRTHVNTDPAELFARILAVRPRGFFLFHNHPSGDLTPSQADVDLTQRVAKVGQQLGTRLLGHAVVSRWDERWIIV